MIDALNLPTNYKKLIGTSDDDKPTEGIGALSTFTEIDTGDVYWFDGETWTKVGATEEAFE